MLVICISGAWARTLLDCLVHVFQNALDHGLESAEERRARHKPAQGKLSVRATRTARGTSVCASPTTGAGWIWRHCGRAAVPGKTPTNKTAERIFDAGVSTAARLTQVSGRGVGLNAVRKLLRGLGGDVSLTLGVGVVPGFRPLELTIELPPLATLDDPAPPSRPPPETEGYPSRTAAK